MKVQHPLDWKLPRKPVRRDVAPMGEVYSHLSEEERQVIQIEVGNGASIRGIGAMLGRSPSSISREIKRNTWFPCIASMFVGRVRQCFSAVWADGFPRCRHRFPVM